MTTTPQSRTELQLSRHDLAEVARQSFRSSFLPDDRITELIAEIDAALDA